MYKVLFGYNWRQFQASKLMCPESLQMGFRLKSFNTIEVE
jgi:hypothetical protein